MLAALVALSLTKGLVWISVFPIWKIADEPAHFDNIQYRAEHMLHAPPNVGGAIDKVMGPGVSPELKLSWKATNKYYQGSFLANTRRVPEEERLAAIGATPDSRRTDGQMPALGYPGLYYNIATIPYGAFRRSSILTRAFAVRCLSMLFGLMAVLATFFAAELACESRAIAFAAAALVALQPMFSQQTAAVNNDAGAIGICAIVFLLQMRIVAALPRSPSKLDGLLLGVCTGLAILCKPQGLGMLPGDAVVSALVLRGRWREREVWSFIGAMAGGVLTLVAVPPVWSRLFPAPQPILHVALAKKRELGPFPSLLGFPGWVDGLAFDYKQYLVRSSWGQFGWLDFALGGSWIDRVERLASLCTLGGIAAITLRVVTPKKQRLWWSVAPTAFAAFSAYTGVIFILFAEYYARVHLKIVGVIQGRNFLFMLPAFAIVVAVSLGSLVPKRFRVLVAAAIVTGALALNVAALATIVSHFYGG